MTSIKLVGVARVQALAAMFPYITIGMIRNVERYPYDTFTRFLHCGNIMLFLQDTFTGVQAKCYFTIINFIIACVPRHSPCHPICQL